MKSLILETSTESALLAIIEDNQLLAEKHLLGGPQLSKELGLEIQKIIALAPPPYDRIIIGAGPGSYTGIRVGAAMAQALAFGWKIPLYTVSSLTAFAPNEKNLITVFDARSGGLFIQENFNTSKLIKIEEAETVLKSSSCIASPHPEKILARIPGLPDLQQTKPNPFIMAQFATLSARPDLSYLSNPGNFA